MKKIVTLVLAIALLMTSVVAIAETHATPNINSFATMKVKYDESNRIYTITLSKPVDRLLIKWAEKGAEPEELAVGEDLQATAIAWGHKYMPGTTQRLGTSTFKVAKGEGGVNYNDETSEWAYSYSDTTGNKPSSPVYFRETTTTGPKMNVYAEDWNWDGTPEGYDIEYVNGEGELDYYFADTLAEVELFYNNYTGFQFGKLDVTAPQKFVSEGTGKDNFGNKTDELIGYKDGSIQGKNVSRATNTKLGTVVATPAQTAYMTVQGEWAVYYNRAGKIVGIEYFDGQF